MTKLLEQAIEKIRERPEEDQDRAAYMLLALLEEQDQPEQLDAETIAAIREGIAQAERGEFATEEEMEAFFARHRK